ncbi:MAG TPA: cytochrome C class I, partial [Hyphomonadaceae bacterium]|nr:cytochrome C class I [Hyphomonadaceae bacterium]
FNGYSGTLASMEGDWDYEALDAFLLNPRGYVNGTAMSFAGLRRDPERMNVIAYLASQSPNAPPFPAPLPVEEEMAAEVEVDVEAPQGVALEEAAEDLTEASNDAAAAVAEEAAGIVEQVEDAADEAVEDATEAADEAVNGRRGPTNH